MAAKKQVGGGSESARDKGLVGVLFYVTVEQRQRIAAAAALAGAPSVRAWGTSVLTAAAEKQIREKA